MKKLLSSLAITVAMCAASSSALADVYVNGYYRSDGTYVEPHYRSSPNSTDRDNWSTRGNQNPYTGEYGTRTPRDSYGGYGSSSPFGGGSNSSSSPFNNSFGSTGGNWPDPYHRK